MNCECTGPPNLGLSGGCALFRKIVPQPYGFQACPPQEGCGFCSAPKSAAADKAAACSAGGLAPLMTGQSIRKRKTRN